MGWVGSTSFWFANLVPKRSEHPVDQQSHSAQEQRDQLLREGQSLVSSLGPDQRDADAPGAEN